MDKIQLSINSRIDIIHEDILYKSIIQEFDDRGITIGVPYSKGEYLTLEKEAEIEANYYDNKGNVFSMYFTVEGRKKEGTIPFYMLSKPYNIKKIQRRDFVRVDVAKSINCGIKKDDEIKKIKAILLDLSGGGMRIRTSEKLESGDALLIEVEVDGVVVRVEGKVIRSIKGENKEYYSGIEFENIREATRDQIIKMVFTLMRKQRELK